MEDGIVLLSPRDKTGQELMQQVLDGGGERSLWQYRGVEHSDPHTRDCIASVFYASGGTRRERHEGNFSETEFDGAINIHLDLQDVADDDARKALRYIGYYLGGLRVEPDSTAEQMRLRPKKNCKVCNGLLIKRAELEWQICDVCSAICEHEYKWGLGQAGGRLAHMPFCTKCGRADPDWKPSENPAEDLLKTVSEGDIDVLVLNHPDQTATILSKKK